MNTKLAGVKFGWQFDMILLSSKHLKDYIVLPLLYSNTEFQLRESELVKAIQSKDKEIEDFKLQGVKLTRSIGIEAYDFNIEIIKL